MRDDSLLLWPGWRESTLKKISDYSRPFSLDEVVTILRPVCSALNYAHNLAIYHCDIKPANILLGGKAEEIFLTDFGVAHWAFEQGSGGTVPYMAPEQFTKTAVDIHTDIYALGIAVYEMLSGGQVPFQGDQSSPGGTTHEKIVWEHLHMPLPDLRLFNPNISINVIESLQRALLKDPTQRYDSALEMLNAFENARAVQKLNTEAPNTFKQSAQQFMHSRMHERVLSNSPAIGQTIQGPHFFGRSGERSGTLLPIPNEGLIIGRSKCCQLHLQESSVSRTHARIIRSRDEIYIQDEYSSLGTYVNGKHIPPGMLFLLKHGDVIQVGYYQVFELRIK